MATGRKAHKPPYTLLLIAALAALLVILAVLQYGWLGQVSVGEREIMRTSLRNRANIFREELNREIGRVNSILEMCAQVLHNQSWVDFGEYHDKWNATAPYPGLVKDLFLANTRKDGQLGLMQFDKTTKRFEAADWPANLAGLRKLYERRQKSEDYERERKRLFEKRFMGENIPALVKPIEKREARDRSEGDSEKMLGLVIITLDRDYIGQALIPALVKRNFADNDIFDYDLIVFNRDNPRDLIYKSGEQSAVGSPPGDETVTKFSLHIGSLTTEDRESWEVLIKHRASALDAAVAKARNRNLAVSFGILTLLAISMIIIVINARRAQQLARRQMEFVAGVSHEFRTPLSVIHAISENLADGLITSRHEIERCGEVIRNDVRRLADMVEQVLEFAGAYRGKSLYQPAPVDLTGLIERVLARYCLTEANAGLHVEKEIEPGLPLVLADEAALESALRNILDNAVKYGGAHHWVGVKARARANGQTRRVEITVEDRGRGIPAAELPHIFEPFYRGREVLAAQIHGNGLGLSLVKNIIEAHGGTVTVASTPGKGSAFTLNLPAASDGRQSVGTTA